MRRHAAKRQKQPHRSGLTLSEPTSTGRNTRSSVYIAELEADIMPIDGLIGFAGSDAGRAYFGEDTAKGIAAHAEEIKAAGAKYCDCPACAAVAAILEKKADMLK